jgi:hypothetical protein
MTPSRTRRQRVLLCRDQVLDELQVGEDRLEELIDSNMLTEVRIRGHRRFDSEEVDQINLQFATSMSRGGARSSVRSCRGTV